MIVYKFSSYESIDTEVADGKSALPEVQVYPSESVSQWMKGGQPWYFSGELCFSKRVMVFFFQEGRF